MTASGGGWEFPPDGSLAARDGSPMAAYDNEEGTMFKPRTMIALLLASAFLFALAGCGDDDPADPGVGGGGGGGGGGDAFDQTTAMSQAQVAGPQGVALVESMQDIAGGVTLANKAYAWNAETQQWEYHYVYELAGYQYDWFLAVQYLDGAGNPVMESVGATSARHTMTGVADYSVNQAGFNLDYSYTYEYDVTLAGLGTDTVVMTGNGGFDLDYTYSGQGVNQTATYALVWQTQGDGISYPTGGCPTGTIRYAMDPYYMDLVFNGSGTATSTLYDGGGNAVAGGGSSYPLACAK